MRKELVDLPEGYSVESRANGDVYLFAETELIAVFPSENIVDTIEKIETKAWEHCKAKKDDRDLNLISGKY